MDFSENNKNIAGSESKGSENSGKSGKSGKTKKGKKEKKDRKDKALTSKDLTKLKKKELLQIMLVQGKEIDRLRKRNAELEEKLADREIEFSEIGSLAQASMQITDLFKDAEEAAIIYLENIRRKYERY
jgi:uncharacterized protein with gpF-like domain